MATVSSTVAILASWLSLVLTAVRASRPGWYVSEWQTADAVVELATSRSKIAPYTPNSCRGSSQILPAASVLGCSVVIVNEKEIVIVIVKVNHISDNIVIVMVNYIPKRYS